MPNVDVLIGGQYGSEAKGALAGFINELRRYDLIISNSGSQAGHTFKPDANTTIVTRHVPVVSVIDPNSQILLSPACVIDEEVLIDEIHRFSLYDRIKIHPNAALISCQDKMNEIKLITDIGSTGKGNGAALTNKLMRRRGSIVKESLTLYPYVITIPDYHTMIHKANFILIEGAQGFSLSVDEQFWPYCTSRNCWVGQALADAWIHPRNLNKVWMVIRTYPIRVAGHSGGYYPDQTEISWEEIGVEPEITTVTKRIRRVFTISYQQVIDAIRINRPDYLAISHLDYLPLDVRGRFIDDLINTIRSTMGYAPAIIVGSGPLLTDWKFYD